MCGHVPRRVVREVVSKLRKEYECVDIKFDHKNKHLDDENDGECGAYFQIEDDKPVIRVSTVGREPAEWLYNFIHETCHYDQWLTDDPTYVACTEYGGVDCADLANLWIAGKIELNVDQREEIFGAIFKNERDAERRAIHKLTELGIAGYYVLPRLIQENWAYIMEYIVARESRVWLPANNRPYEIEEIVSAQPRLMTVSMGCIEPFWKHYFDAVFGRNNLQMMDRDRGFYHGRSDDRQIEKYTELQPTIR